MDIGVFGGTFNPFHNDELRIARHAIVQVPLSKLLFVPNGIPPHKKTDVLDKELRYELLKAGTAGETKMEVSRLEIDRPGVTWTIDTLRQLRAQLGESVRLNFVMGEDNIKAFEQYELRDEFCKLCRLLVAPRQIASQSTLADWQARLPAAEIVLLNCQAGDISSTKIRELIRSGKPYAHLLPDAELKIIEAKGLYKQGVDLKPAA